MDSTGHRKTKKKLKALYVGDSRKPEKVRMFNVILTLLEKQYNNYQLKDKNYVISINHTVTRETLDDEVLDAYNIVVCSRGLYLKEKEKFDFLAIGHLVVVFANENSDEFSDAVAVVSITDGIITPIKGDMFFIPDV